MRQAGAAGLAGICIEDTALPGQAALPVRPCVARIAAAARAARALPGDFVLTARADGVMLGTYDMAEATARLSAMARAGADCLTRRWSPALPRSPRCAARWHPIR